MSLQEAVARATRETLSHYLAPELVEQLTEEILHRVGPEAQHALGDFLGFSSLRATAPRAKTANTGRKKRKERPETLDDGAPRPSAHRSNGAREEQSPQTAEMS